MWQGAVGIARARCLYLTNNYNERSRSIPRAYAALVSDYNVEIKKCDLASRGDKKHYDLLLESHTACGLEHRSLWLSSRPGVDETTMRRIL